MNQGTQQRLSAAYSKQDAGARRRRSLAASFKKDARLEQLLSLKETDPAVYARLSVTTRMSVGMYLQAKEAYEQEQNA